MTHIDRDLAERLGRETVAIIDAGGYHSPSGAWVDISGALAAARQGTVEYPPDRTVPAPEAHGRWTRFGVENATNAGSSGHSNARSPALTAHRILRRVPCTAPVPVSLP